MNVSLAEYAETDAQWFWEVLTVLTAFEEGRQMAAGVQQARRSMQA